MITQELMAYIKKQLGLGVEKAEIKNSLLGNGWQEYDVDRAFESLNSFSGPGIPAAAVSEKSTEGAERVNAESREPEAPGVQQAQTGGERAETAKEENKVNEPEAPGFEEVRAEAVAGSNFESKGKIGKSMALIKASWQILKKDKEIMWFPVISGITTLLITGVFLAVTFFSELGRSGSPDNQYMYYALLFLFYITTYFVVTFFNSGLVTCAHIRLNGGDPTFQDGMNNAKKHIGKIFAWALVAATVGIVMQVISDKSKLLGKIAVSLLSMAWNLLVFFIVPVLIIENVDVLASIKRSGEVFRKTWGENVVGNLTMGFVFGILAMLGFFLAVPIAIFFSINSNGSLLFLLAPIGFTVMYWILLSIISSSLNAIYKVALYQYATTGKISEGFDRSMIENAFKPKK